MKDVLRLSLPITLWLISFSGLYGLHALICAGALPDPALGRLALVAAASLAILLQILALLTLRSHRFGSDTAFARRVGLALASVALVATAWTALPVAVLPICAT
jgi:hypothetical protein